MRMSRQSEKARPVLEKGKTRYFDNTKEAEEGRMRMENRQWEYLATLARDIGNINLAVLVIGQFILEKGINRILLLQGIAASATFYVAGFFFTFLCKEE